MTTFELPPEPPIGSRVRGVVQDANEPITAWTHDPQIGAWITPGRPGWMRWSQLLDAYRPQGVTLIEPDPWPTASLIVADWTSGGVEGGRGLLYRETDADQYWTIRENESVYPEHSGDSLANVVPVKPVPVAEMEALRASIKALGYGPESTRSAGSLLDTALRLLEATDALGVSND